MEGLKANAGNGAAAVELRNPDTVAEANDLNGTDVAIVRGTVGVAENGCIWIPQTMKEKALLKLAQMVVGRGLECRADHSFQNFIAHLAVGVVAAGAAFLQCFVQFHNVGI